MKKWRKEAILWVREHENQLACFFGIVVIALGSFTFGVLKGTGLSQRPMTVMRPLHDTVVLKEKCDSENNDVMRAEDCVFVGSTKGKKYYPPSCSYAKKVTKENLRCFTSDEDALAKGYTKSTSCK